MPRTAAQTPGLRRAAFKERKEERKREKERKKETDIGQKRCLK